jgi:PDZ domain
MLRFLSLLATLLMLLNTAQAEDVANPYVTSYLALDRPQVALQPDANGPKLFRGVDKDADNNKMLVKGFDMLGYSSFEAKQVLPELALEQAKKLKADLVLLYSQETGKTPASVRLQQLKAQAKDGQVDVDNSLNYAYYASYWVKLAPPVIGVHVRATAKDAPVKGLHVYAVIEDSPAFKLGLQENDVITQIGSLAMSSPAELSKAAQQYQGQLVEVKYDRQGELTTGQMQLNMRSQ